jgi:hypothetical protein
MEEKIYQNFDQPQDNPLEIIPDKKIATSELKPINKLSLSPKITLLIILGAIIFVLFLLSLVITQSRNSANKSTNIIPSITPVPTVTDSNTNYSLIPSPYQIDFQKINNYSSQDLNLPIPQIDTTVGQ